MASRTAISASFGSYRGVVDTFVGADAVLDTLVIKLLSASLLLIALLLRPLQMEAGLVEPIVLGLLLRGFALRVNRG